ncbi:hypothetical protein Apa02nite_043810 [Actinoplanes palleronii]|uniref:Uncharacterized protein n=1 Tax=Actinoplanes palleronii TaxID=113570 RepID=A0ABQ4BC83_9ACTN|nr:hypothetical protein Apa02nite_043810 [Actinoplanes palleronii]
MQEPETGGGVGWSVYEPGGVRAGQRHTVDLRASCGVKSYEYPGGGHADPEDAVSVDMKRDIGVGGIGSESVPRASPADVPGTVENDEFVTIGDRDEPACRAGVEAWDGEWQRDSSHQLQIVVEQADGVGGRLGDQPT